MKSFRLLATMSAAVFSMLVATQTSYAQTVPFRASGTDAVYYTATAETSGFGQATHMGRALGSGLAVPIEGTNQWIALGYKFVAANGDEIYFTGGGTIEFFSIGDGEFSAIWSGEFNVVGGTGRFANVGPGDAPITVSAINDPFFLQEDGSPLPGAIWTYSWELTGDIDLGKKGRK